MRSPSFVLMLLCLLVGAEARAGMLTSATWVGETFGEINSVGFLDLFPGTPFTLVTSGASLTANGSAAGSALSMVSLSVAAPPVSITGLHTSFFSQTLGGSQTINSANLANQGISGALRNFIGPPNNQGTLVFAVPLSVGVAGTFTSTRVVPGLNIPVEVTATFFPWTTGSHVFTGLTGSTTTPNGAINMGVALPDFTLAGTNHLVDGVGSMTLVSPTRFRVCAGAIFGSFPCSGGDPTNSLSTISATTTRLTLNFLPETGAALLLGTALVGLAVRNRKH